MRKQTAIGVLVSATCVVSAAAAEPTLEETKDFITSLAGGCGEFKESRRDDNLPNIMIWFDGKTTIRFEETVLYINIDTHSLYADTDGDWRQEERKRYRNHARLADLSPTLRIDDNPEILYIKCSATDCFTVNDDGEAGTAAEMPARFCSAGVAERLAKAFSHLITLSGGKESLF